MCQFENFSKTEQNANGMFFTCLLRLMGMATCHVHMCLNGTKDSMKDMRMWMMMKALNDFELQELKTKENIRQIV